MVMAIIIIMVIIFKLIIPWSRHDAMAGCTGTRFRPLPPAWLLVGPPRSGTPVHDHPLTVAWNALLVGQSPTP